jgi:hypothetical protein
VFPEENIWQGKSLAEVNIMVFISIHLGPEIPTDSPGFLEMGNPQQVKFTPV